MSDITYLPGKEPHEKEHRLIFRNVDRKGWNPKIKTYLAEGGYEMAMKALKMKPQEVIDEVKASGLRGRGGAGFPTGIKWGFIPPNNTKPVYLICNCDESEPGTFKDRYIAHQDPHQLIEGMAISAYAVGAHVAYIYIREEFPEAAIILEKAIAEAKKNGFLGKDIQGSGFDLEIYVHRGAAAYICGEETGLIESLEGKRPYPRIKPPYFPAAIGLYMAPTTSNHSATLSTSFAWEGKNTSNWGPHEIQEPASSVFQAMLRTQAISKSKLAKSPSKNFSMTCAEVPKMGGRSRPSSQVVHRRRSYAVTKLSRSVVVMTPRK